jgi:hypothetical protein
MYYVGRNGSQSGPYPLDELKNMAATGRLAPNDLVWTDGMSEWKPASAALPEVFAAAAPAATPAPPPPAAGAIHPSYAPAPPPGAVDPMYPAGTPVDSYLWLAVLANLLCCPPLGIPAVIYAAQVQPRQQHGDIAGAMAASKKALSWAIAALIVGILCNIGSGVTVTWWLNMLKTQHIQLF